LHKFLVDGGKIYGRASTPFQKHLQFFTPTYEERIKSNDPWPGICADMEKGWPALYQYLPPFMNLLDVDVLYRSLTKANFDIRELSYFSIEHPEFKLNGREGIGFVAVKR